MRVPDTTNELTLTPVEGGTLLSLVITYANAEVRDAVLATGMTDGMETSYARLEAEVLASAPDPRRERATTTRAPRSLSRTADPWSPASRGGGDSRLHDAVAGLDNRDAAGTQEPGRRLEHPTLAHRAICAAIQARSLARTRAPRAA